MLTPQGTAFLSLRLRVVFFASRMLPVTPATIFIVTQLTYQDAGVYTCEGRNNASGDTSPWASATTELQLCCKLCYNTDNWYSYHTMCTFTIML